MPTDTNIPEDPDAAIALILDAVPRIHDIESEERLVEAVQDIGMAIRMLGILVPENEVSIVQAWIKRLNGVPAAIGVHSERSNDAQRVIDGIRNGIEAYLDEDWPTNAGTAIFSSEDSGILWPPTGNSGILLPRREALPGESAESDSIFD